MSTGFDLLEFFRRVSGWSPIPLVIPSAPPVTVIDRRTVGRPIALSPIIRVIGEKRIRTAVRSLDEVSSVVLHQLDCELGISKSQLAEAGGDMLEARIQRAMRLPYHDVVLRGNIVVRNHPYTVRTAHGDRGNAGVGIGIEGRYPLLASGRTPKHTELALVIPAARRAVELAVIELRGAQPRIEIQAHRQWSRARGPDPGEEIWRAVALHAVAALGLTVNYELGDDGMPIPIEWDPSAHYTVTGQRGG